MPNIFKKIYRKFKKKKVGTDETGRKIANEATPVFMARILNYMESFQGEQKALRQKITELEDQLLEWQKASLFNAITLSNKKSGPFVLHTPWINMGDRGKSFTLERLDSGRLCFMSPDSSTHQGKPVYVMTLQKSGTWFIMSVISALGFQDIKVSPMDSRFADFRPHPAAYKTPGHSHPMPYALQVELTLPGQILLGHAKYYQASIAYPGNVTLLAVRNLRTVLISWMRFIAHNDNPIDYPAVPKQDEFTPDELRTFIKNSPFAERLKEAVQSILAFKRDRKDAARFVRFEQLLATDKQEMMPSIEAIAEATGCSHEEIIRAVESCRHKPTMTYTGKISELEGIWTDKVEEAFVEKGWDVLNEELGYPRTYVATQVEA